MTEIRRYDPRHVLQALGLHYVIKHMEKHDGTATISNTELNAIIEDWKLNEIQIVQVLPMRPSRPHVRIFRKKRV